MHHPPATDRLAPYRLPALLTLALIFSMVVGYGIFRLRSTKHQSLRPIAINADWIAAPGPAAYSGYFRKNLRITSHIKNAWIVVSPHDAFEVSVNQNPLGRIYLWRPTRPYHNGISEKGQRLSSTLSAMAMNFPREYQWDSHANHRVPIFVDLTRSLKIGKNTICIEVESRRAPAKVAFEGEIELWSGEKIRIASDKTWLAEPVPPGIQAHDWTQPDYDDLDWQNAVVTTPPPGKLLRSLDPALFTAPFDGQWLRHPSASANDSVWFESKWNLDSEPSEAWLRLATNRHYDLFINDTRVTVASQKNSTLDSGEWIFGLRRAHDPSAKPELLDPDEVGSIFVGKRFESPRHADPVLDTVTPTENLRNRTKDKPRATNVTDMPGTFDPIRSLPETRRTPTTPEGTIEKLVPNALSRDRKLGGYFGYSLRGLLRTGENTIRVRLSQPTTSTRLNWSGQLAIDGMATLPSGVRTALAPASGWESWIHDRVKVGPKMAELPHVKPISLGMAQTRDGGFPKFDYRGSANLPASQTTAWRWYMLITAIVTFSSIAWFLRRCTRRLEAWTPQDLIRRLFSILLVPTITIITGLLLESCFRERHELLMFRESITWIALFLIAGGLAFFISVGDRVGREGDSMKKENRRQRCRRLSQAIKQLPQTRAWTVAIIWILMLCGFLRANKLEFQPLDDDEYASTQAVLAICETGVPQFVPENVWYTRSPLFHYVTAIPAWVFGPNLWSMRLQTVGWSIATAWLLYLCGSRLLRSPWVGLGAMLLFSIHPFQIYTGHIIRFYQMQQFFALLTVYWFCKGFVVEQSQKYRYLTIVAFLAAVLSQEISAVLGVPLALGYLLFAKDLGWKANTKLIVVAAWALALIVLDFVVFQTRCLTRVEGISPNLEAAVKPHFWQPYNFFAIFIGYSRLHVMLSAFLLAGLPLAWRERRRNTIAFHFMLFAGVVLTNLLVTGVSLRYQFWLIPIWILLGLDSVRAVITWICDWAYDAKTQQNRHMATVGLITAIIFCGVILSWSPWRIPGSYDIKILGDSTGAFRYVRSQLRDGDRIAASEPHTHASLLEAGRIDYDISIPLLYDFAVLKDGKLIDRNGGATVVSNLDQFMSVCREHDRVWVVLNKEKFRTRGKNLRWEYPGARFEMFLRKNCQLKHRSYLWNVYLWDASEGHFIPFRQHVANAGQ